MKNFLIATATAIVGVFAPIQGILTTILVLVLLDMATGIYAAYKRNEPIKSGIMKRTVGKIVLYEVGIGAAFLVQTYLTKDMIPAANLIASAVGLVELKSLLENLNSISGTDLLKGVIDKITSQEKKP